MTETPRIGLLQAFQPYGLDSNHWNVFFFCLFLKVGLGKGYDKAGSMGRRLYHLECSARINLIAPHVF